MTSLDSAFQGQLVLVRTYSAGIHYGRLAARCGREVLLEDARRIWRWVGAFSLSEIAENGVSNASHLSVSTPSILLTEAIELLPISETAATCLASIPAYQP